MYVQEGVPAYLIQYLRGFCLSFVDSEAERAALMDTVFPKLREYAATKGVELHVVDPHWGVWDPKLDDERTVDLCKEEIDRCQRLSVGPNFVVRHDCSYVMA